MIPHARTNPPKKDNDALTPERIPAPKKAGVHSNHQALYVTASV